MALLSSPLGEPVGVEDISADPWAPLSIMYVEDGMEYCQEDERGRVLNPCAIASFTITINLSLVVLVISDANKKPH